MRTNNQFLIGYKLAFGSLGRGANNYGNGGPW